jgi:hypothetical protein
MKSPPAPQCAIILLFAITHHTQPVPAQNSDALASMERKLQHVESNGRLAHPDEMPTTFTEQEVNAYFPSAVQSLHFQAQPGIVTANTGVDFDRLRAGANSSNPLLSILTGVHDVTVMAHAHGAGGKGFVQVDSASLDGVQIPRFVLQLFVEKYLRSKYPQVGLDSRGTLRASTSRNPAGWAGVNPTLDFVVSFRYLAFLCRV